MAGDGLQDLPGIVVEDQDLPRVGGVAGAPLPQHLDHHVVRGLVDKGDHGLLAVDGIGPVRVLRRGGLGHLPHEVPGQHVWQLVAQRLHVGPVHIQRLGGAHVGDGIVMAREGAFLQKLRHHFVLRGTLELQLAAPEAVALVGEQVVQRHDHVVSRQIGGDVVGIGDAHVGRGVGGDVGDDVVVDGAVVRVGLQLHLDVGIQRLEVPDRLLVNLLLGVVAVVLGPEGEDVLPGGVEFRRHLKARALLPAMAARKSQKQEQENQRQPRLLPSGMPDLSVRSNSHGGQFASFGAGCRVSLSVRAKSENLARQHSTLHPLIPPLDTPDMILLRKARNSAISGTEITTTAAIMAGMFSRPKPFWRISWMPLDTRK